MEIVTIHNRQDLLKHKSAIESLFIECFGGRVLGDLWTWAYIANPNGEPVVTLCYDNNCLVGHYAIIPMQLILRNTKLNSYLSMTTMVSESHRKFGLFPKLASENYQNALNLGVDFVMGFPNAKSAPGFKKRLNWTLPPIDYVASVSKSQLLKKEVLSLLVSEDSFSPNFHDQETRKWRMSRPEANYVWDDGLLYKKFGNAIDLMYFNSVDHLEKLPENKNINILMRSENCQFRDSIVFEYQFGGISLNKEFSPSIINRQLCLSDVF